MSCEQDMVRLDFHCYDPEGRRDITFTLNDIGSLDVQVRAHNENKGA
jgi:hypothetical protein